MADELRRMTRAEHAAAHRSDNPEVLRAEIERLREALKPFAADLEDWNNYSSNLTYLDLERARKALSDEG